MTEVGHFSGITTTPKATKTKKKPKEETIEFVSGNSSLVSGLTNVRRQSFSSKESSNPSSNKNLQGLNNNGGTPDSKGTGTGQTVATTDSRSVGSGDLFHGVSKEGDEEMEIMDNDTVVNERSVASVPTIASQPTIVGSSSNSNNLPTAAYGFERTMSRQLGYDEETGTVISQSVHGDEIVEDVVELSLCTPEEALDQQKSLLDVVDDESPPYNNNNYDDDDVPPPPPAPEAAVPQPTKTPPKEIDSNDDNNNNTQKRSLLPFFLVGIICLIFGGILGAIISRNTDQDLGSNDSSVRSGSAANSGYDTAADSSDDSPSSSSGSTPAGVPTTSPTRQVYEPTPAPTTAEPTVFVPTMRPTRSPTSVPTRRPTLKPTSVTQVLGRSERLNRIQIDLGGSCHPDADDWFNNVDTWGQEAWVVNAQPNRDQLWMERYVVACLYFSLLQENPLTEEHGNNWLSNQHVCEWDLGSNETVAMNCTADGTREVTTFEASQLAVVNGTLPPAIGALTSLERLGFLRPANLIGTIPSSISQLKLKFLRCIHCSLNGTIPTEIGGLSMLTTLFLGDSFDKTRYLTGTIPTQIGKMTLLQEFSIRNARLTGAIPSTIINLWNLTELYVTGNTMSGDIPLLPENVTKCEVAGISYNGDFPEGNCFPNIDDTVCSHWSQNCREP